MSHHATRSWIWCLLLLPRTCIDVVGVVEPMVLYPTLPQIPSSTTTDMVMHGSSDAWLLPEFQPLPALMFWVLRWWFSIQTEHLETTSWTVNCEAELLNSQQTNIFIKYHKVLKLNSGEIPGNTVVNWKNDTHDTKAFCLPEAGGTPRHHTSL